jgi:pSer/pThr/pTyr-binding forkhead associated (FHA) protein
LLTSQHASEEKKIIELDQEDITIGRESGHVRFEDDPLVSRAHMRIYIANGRYFVMDLESTNGTFVGVETEYKAVPGEVFLIGDIIYKIAYA